ncbi:unnamed protein product [Pieris brassicae]|uniref:Uncharacterized protein n=1 Tax=Pieris brassicae TaxID=7116 RepID=A0A9P0T4Y7_PIEBR|nr:unnamed protein product [Pieris brassicae]
MPDAPNYAAVTAAPTVPTLPTMGAKAPLRPKFPPLVVETLPNWTHHFRILKEKLGRAPNARPYGRGCRFTPDEEAENSNRRAGTFAQTARRPRSSQRLAPAATTHADMSAVKTRPSVNVEPTATPHDEWTLARGKRRSGRSRRGPTLAALEASSAHAPACAPPAITKPKQIGNSAISQDNNNRHRDTALASAQTAAAPAMPTTTVPSTRDTALEAMLQILMAMQKNQDPTPLFLKAAERLNRGVQYNDGA